MSENNLSIDFSCRDCIFYTSDNYCRHCGIYTDSDNSCENGKLMIDYTYTDSYSDFYFFNFIEKD
jgi:hypothetical protein